MKVKITKFKRIESTYPVMIEESGGIKFVKRVSSEFEIPFSIYSGNGLGKSTILEAISFALTGKNLDGKEFEQIYDNRVDLHDAIADVSYFDNYGNEWQRIVKPVFQTNRAGIEEIKIKRSTECRKNGIICNDFSDEFKDFYKFGTDYFFNQKEDVQRSIFIDILKSKLPDYDVNASSLKLKELKKSQKIEVDLVKNLQLTNKNTKDVPVPEIPADIEKLNNEYLSLQNSSNTDVISEINKKNNDAILKVLLKKREIATSILESEISIERINQNIKSETEKLENCKSAKFIPKEIESTEVLEKSVKELTEKLRVLEYFESIEKYAEKYFIKNPVLVENQKKIVEISERKFVFSNQECGCPLTKEKCEIAKINAEKTELWVFNSENEIEIKELKSENRSILEKEMADANREYNTVKSDLQEAEIKLNRVIDENKLIEFENRESESNFDEDKDRQIEALNINIESKYGELEYLNTQLIEKRTELTSLIELTPEKLPEQLEISIRLKAANRLFLYIDKKINKAVGVNENNVKLIAERSKEIKEKQANLLIIGEKIVTLTQEISDYFSNLSNIVKQEFAGDIELDVQLLEFVMSKYEYKDCFKITADNNLFPSECNGALQNNVKMQILFNLQRLKGYTGVTVMDNCEANTTQPINTMGLNCVMAYATLDKELIIK